MYNWGNDRRINAASNYLKKEFGTRIQKLSIDAGFTCPNRDGTTGTGGCAYCNNDAFNPSYCDKDKPVERQIEEGIRFHESRYRSAGKYFAYFQAFSNTYGSVDDLKRIYAPALEHDEIVGIIAGTRPDCIDEYKLEYFASLSEKYYVVIEYGIESVYDTTLQKINRGHTFEQAVRALELTKNFGVKSGGHFIFGLQEETRRQMKNSVSIVSDLPLHTVKFHQLQIVRGTRYAREYLADPRKFNLFTLDEYVDFMADYLSCLNPDMIVERLAGETQPRNIVSPLWELRYDQVLQKIENRMEKLDYWQGKNLANNKPVNSKHEHFSGK
jgi:radical SAM protein (TIGR01212 family)